MRRKTTPTHREKISQAMKRVWKERGHKLRAYHERRSSYKKPKQDPQPPDLQPS